MSNAVLCNPAEPDPRDSADGQPVADPSPEETGLGSFGPVVNAGPSPAQAAVPKPKVDRSQFISQTTPATAPSGAKQTKFPLRKPGGKLFFRASDDETAHMTADIIEGNMGKAYVIGAKVTRDARLDRLVSQVLLVPCINERNQAFVWFIKTSSREWYQSALEMVEEAKDRWIRIEADSYAQAYKMEDASAYPDLAKSMPNWPLPPSDILDDVLTSSAITGDNDPVLTEIVGKRRSRGAAA